MLQAWEYRRSKYLHRSFELDIGFGSKASSGVDKRRVYRHVCASSLRLGDVMFEYFHVSGRAERQRDGHHYSLRMMQLALGSV